VILQFEQYPALGITYFEAFPLEGVAIDAYGRTPGGDVGGVNEVLEGGLLVLQASGLLVHFGYE
jgi:hypothetical protein